MGYIYIRWHPSYGKDVKLGQTKDFVERETTYITGEKERGHYLHLFKVNNHTGCELYLQDKFKEYSIQDGSKCKDSAPKF